MSSAPRTDGPTSPDDCELRAHIFDNPLILRKKHVLSFLKSLKPKLDDLIQNRLRLPTWMPTEDDQSQLDKRTKNFLKKLELPCVNGRPSVLLHQLGEEPELQERVKGVFRPDAPQNAIFVNTSGSGKTRLLLEGLCQHWGFYFTSCVDSSFLGSVDLQTAIQSTIPNNSRFRRPLPPGASPVSNEDIAGRVFKRVFLARVLIFRLFVEAMMPNCSSDNGLTERDFRRKWLLLQLQPSFFLDISDSDPFDDLTHKLSAYSTRKLKKLTREVLGHIRDTLKPYITSTSSPGRIPLYCIIDEARFAAREHADAFRSRTMEPRPILRPLIQTFSTLTSGLNVFIIVAGTGLSQSDVDDTMSSAIMKPSTYRRCYDTGAFEGWEGRNGMSAWVRRFVPEWVFRKRKGEKLKEQMEYWLKGRYRFVAGFVTELLLHGYRQPIRLLDMYVSRAVGFRPAINSEAYRKEKQAQLEDIELEQRDTFDFKKLENDIDKFAKFGDFLPMYVMRSIFLGPLGDDDQSWVEHGLGRLRKEQGAGRVVFDEPLVVAAANRWFNAKSNRNYANFARGIGINEARGSSNGLENFIVCCLDLIFSAEKQRKLAHIFNFRGTPPSWAERPAKLVSVQFSRARSRPDVYYAHHTGYIGPSATLGTYAKSPEDTLEWLDHGFRTTFCFPCLNMGPDVIFVLELYNKKLLWVVLQAKYSGTSEFLDNSKMEDAVRSVTPKAFFRFKDGRSFSKRQRKNLCGRTKELLKRLPYGCDDAGPYSLLRVIASFPARADINNGKIWKWDDNHPIATLNMDFVKEMTKDLSPLNILENWERDWWMESNDSRISKRRRGSDAAEAECDKGGEKRRKMEEGSDASDSSSRKPVKRERDADLESGYGMGKRRKTLDVIKQEFGAAKGRKHRHLRNMVSVSLNRVL